MFYACWMIAENSNSLCSVSGFLGLVESIMFWC